MRTKVLIGFAALTLGATLGFSTVQANDPETCGRFCALQYSDCLASRPDTPLNRQLCESYYRDVCLTGCGGYL